MSHADVERVCLDAVEACIIENKDKMDSAALEAASRQQKERFAYPRGCV